MRVNELASNLSVGQRKRISIARWLLKNFKIYFIDEPFSALDDEATSMIEHLIQELNSKGCSFVITGHRPSQVNANRIIFKMHSSIFGWLTIILKRDLLIAFRKSSTYITPLVFFLIVVTFFPLALGPQESLLVL